VEQAVGRDSSVSLVLPGENTQVGLASCVIGASDTSWRPDFVCSNWLKPLIVSRTAGHRRCDLRSKGSEKREVELSRLEIGVGTQVRRASEVYNACLLVNISVNRLNSGRIQVCVAKPQYNPNHVQTYPSIEESRRVLSGFGIDDKELDAILKLASEVGPNELLRFSPMDIPQHVLWQHGFKV
jgi:hypothetical protein